jgi:hypothetical protein
MKIVEKVGTHKNIVIMVCHTLYIITWHFSYHTLYQPEVMISARELIGSRDDIHV